MTASILAVAVLALIQTQTADRFDLMCSGVRQTTDISGRSEQPYSTHYRLDLSQRKWCEGECLAFQPLDAQPGQLTLQRTAPGEVVQVSNFVDRVTGKHFVSAISGRGMSGIVMRYDGQCEARPFSGFPEIQTRF